MSGGIDTVLGQLRELCDSLEAERVLVLLRQDGRVKFYFDNAHGYTMHQVQADLHPDSASKAPDEALRTVFAQWETVNR